MGQIGLSVGFGVPADRPRGDATRFWARGMPGFIAKPTFGDRPLSRPVRARQKVASPSQSAAFSPCQPQNHVRPILAVAAQARTPTSHTSRSALALTSASFGLVEHAAHRDRGDDGVEGLVPRSHSSGRGSIETAGSPRPTRQRPSGELLRGSPRHPREPLPAQQRSSSGCDTQPAVHRLASVMDADRMCLRAVPREHSEKVS
jgi:hypothetical protein